MAESVLVVNRKDFPEGMLGNATVLKIEQINISVFDHLPYFWMIRSEAETDPMAKQIIPYVLSEYKGRLATYQRQGNEKRLTGLWSAGVGGHINPEDSVSADGLLQIARAGALRELHEEFMRPKPLRIDFIGFINEEISKVGRVHSGLVFRVVLKEKPEPASELTDLTWLTKKEILVLNTEHWTKMALSLITD